VYLQNSRSLLSGATSTTPRIPVEAVLTQVMFTSSAFVFIYLVLRWITEVTVKKYRQINSWPNPIVWPVKNYQNVCVCLKVFTVDKVIQSRLVW